MTMNQLNGRSKIHGGGDKPGHKGYFIMNNSWMYQYTYNTVVNKKYLTDTERAAYEKAEINLPYWTAMLSD